MTFFKDHFTFLPLDSRNRMVRIGFGLNDNNPFFRVDFWWFGIRIS